MKAKLTFEKGLNADVSPFELADGFVSDCDNVRFPGSGAERIGGGNLVATFAGAPGWADVLETTSGHHVVALGASSSAGSRVAYAHTLGGGAATEITRYTEGVTITNMTAAGTTVTVTAPAHGRSTGNTVSVWAAIPSTYNAESVAITRIDANTFTYTVASAPAASPATTMGLYSHGTTRSTYTTFGDQATGGDYGGVLIVNLPDDGLYYWAGDASIPMRRMGAGRAETARVARPFGRFIVRLGVTTGGTTYPYRISCSDPADPGSLPLTFDSAPTNQAGDVDKPEIGELIDCLPLGDDLIVYGTKGRMVMRYVEGNSVFQFTKLPGREGLYSKGAVVDTPAGHVFLSTARHVLAHSGGAVRDVSQGRVQSLLYEAEGTNFRLAVHPNRPEVWVMYREDVLLADIPSDSLIWNWEEDTWGKTSEFGGWSALAVGKTFYVFTGNNLTTLDDNKADHSFTASVERQGITAGDGGLVKNLQRSTPLIDTNANWYANPSVTVEHGSSMSADTDPTYANGVPYTIGTSSWANARATGGKFLAWRISIGETLANASAGYYNIKLRSVDLEFTPGGRR